MPSSHSESYGVKLKSRRYLIKSRRYLLKSRRYLIKSRRYLIEFSETVPFIPYIICIQKNNIAVFLVHFMDIIGRNITKCLLVWIIITIFAAAK